MKKLILALLLLSSISLKAQVMEDAAGCKDHMLFNRMPNTLISDCTSDYNEIDVTLSAENIVKKEGTKTFIMYDYVLDEATAPSFFQIIKNYENALQKFGGKKVYYSLESGLATFSAKSGAKEFWVVLNDGGGVKKGNYAITILEMEAMKQEIAASNILEALNTIGSIALYINFESGKYGILPESMPIVDQITEMMKANPAIRISIEGHTDNVGSAAANQTLSENRAKSVMNAIAARGIDKSRMQAKGWGQSKPIDVNTTDAGKAKNRRVEIVKI